MQLGLAASDASYLSAARFVSSPNAPRLRSNFSAYTETHSPRMRINYQAPCCFSGGEKREGQGERAPGDNFPTVLPSSRLTLPLTSYGLSVVCAHARPAFPESTCQMTDSHRCGRHDKSCRSDRSRFPRYCKQPRFHRRDGAPRSYAAYGWLDYLIFGAHLNNSK